MPLVLKKAKIAMYADDSTIYSSETKIEELENVLMTDLRSIDEWVANNKLALNIGKTKSIVFGTRNMLLNEPKLTLVVKDKTVKRSWRADFLVLRLIISYPGLSILELWLIEWAEVSQQLEDVLTCYL